MLDNGRGGRLSECLRCSENQDSVTPGRAARGFRVCGEFSADRWIKFMLFLDLYIKKMYRAAY